MNEIILFITVIALLFGLQLVTNQIKKPLLHLIKISAAILLLLLIWLFARESNVPVRVTLSALVLTSAYREYLSFRKFQSEK